MQNMRKQHRHIGFWGSNGATKTQANSVTKQSAPSAAHGGERVAEAARVGSLFSRVMETFTFFPNDLDVLTRLEPRGVDADWTKVGKDMRCVLDAQRTNSKDDLKLA